MHFKDMISNNDVIKLLEEVGFSEMKDNEEVGYLLKNKNVYYGVRGSQDIEVYLKRGHLNIHLTSLYLNLDLYKLVEGPTFYYHGNLGNNRSGYCVKKMKYKKEVGMEEFKNFLLLSICRDSFLDPEEEEVYKYRMRPRVDEFRIRGYEDWHDWYL